MADGPAYLRSLESQLTLSNIGFGTMFTPSNTTCSGAVTVAAPTVVSGTVQPEKKLKFMLVSTHLHQ